MKQTDRPPGSAGKEPNQGYGVMLRLMHLAFV